MSEMHTATKQEILDLLQLVAEGLMSLGEFQPRFEYLFLDRGSWPVLDHRDKDFFGLVLAKVGWTSENPTEDEEALGWIGLDSFRGWLKGALQKHLSGE